MCQAQPDISFPPSSTRFFWGLGEILFFVVPLPLALGYVAVGATSLLSSPILPTEVPWSYSVYPIPPVTGFSSPTFCPQFSITESSAAKTVLAPASVPPKYAYIVIPWRRPPAPSFKLGASIPIESLSSPVDYPLVHEGDAPPTALCKISKAPLLCSPLDFFPQAQVVAGILGQFCVRN